MRVTANQTWQTNLKKIINKVRVRTGITCIPDIFNKMKWKLALKVIFKQKKVCHSPLSDRMSGRGSRELKRGGRNRAKNPWCFLQRCSRSVWFLAVGRELAGCALNTASVPNQTSTSELPCVQLTGALQVRFLNKNIMLSDTSVATVPVRMFLICFSSCGLKHGSTRPKVHGNDCRQCLPDSLTQVSRSHRSSPDQRM